MKIDKTERVFRRQLEVAFNEGNAGALGDAIIDAMGLEFREEEPGLPERVTASRAGGLIADNCEPVCVDPGCLYREAARRYNAYPHLHALAVRLAKGLEAERNDIGGETILCGAARAALQAAISSGLLTDAGFEDPGAV